MRHHRLAIAILLLLLPLAASASGMRCEGGLVDRGDLAIEVQEACGEPDLVDAWQGGYGHRPHHAVPDVEQWYYNFGPRRLMHILQIRNGRVARIERQGYGFRPSEDGQCSPTEIEPSMSKLRLLARCGEPAQSDSVVVLRNLKHSRYGRVVPVRRETWIYNFGDSRLLRRVRLENGRVVDVDTEGRGFD